MQTWDASRFSTDKGEEHGVRRADKLQQPKCVDDLQITIESHGPLGPQRTIDPADERITEISLRRAEIAQRLPSFVESLDLELCSREYLLDRVSDLLSRIVVRAF